MSSERTEAVVFLDFDGVLNSVSWTRPLHGWPSRDAHCHVCAESIAFDPVNVRRLNRITGGTGAKIVVSSSWRHRYPMRADLVHLLNGAGVHGQVIGRTSLDWEPGSPNGIIVAKSRGVQIQQWLSSIRNKIRSWIILDDVNEFDEFGKDRWIETSWANGGLLDEHVELAIDMLREPSKKIGDLR